MNHRIKSCCQPKEDAIQVLERMRMHNKTLLMLFDDSMQDISMTTSLFQEGEDVQHELYDYDVLLGWWETQSK